MNINGRCSRTRGSNTRKNASADDPEQRDADDTPRFRSHEKHIQYASSLDPFSTLAQKIRETRQPPVRPEEHLAETVKKLEDEAQRETPETRRREEKREIDVPTLSEAERKDEH